MTSFVFGVLASITATAICAVVVKFLLPSLQAALSSELNISGRWCTEFVTPSGNPHTVTIDLKQRFRRVHGRVMVTKRVAATGVTETKLFAGDGYLRDRFITFSARNIAKDALGVQVMLLEVVGDGRVMRGRKLWYSITDETIHDTELEWRRTDHADHG